MILPYFYFDTYYWFLVIPALLIAVIAQINVKSTFHKYQNVYNRKGLTADQVARQILDDNGLSHVADVHTPGELSDHFDPCANVVRL